MGKCFHDVVVSVKLCTEIVHRPEYRSGEVAMGIFSPLSKLKSGLAKTRDSIVRKVQQLASTKSTIDDDLLSTLEDILIAGDVDDGIEERQEQEAESGRP